MLSCKICEIFKKNHVEEQQTTASSQKDEVFSPVRIIVINFKSRIILFLKNTEVVFSSKLVNLKKQKTGHDYLIPFSHWTNNFCMGVTKITLNVLNVFVSL